MGSIKFKNFEKLRTTTNHTYSDLHLDITQSEILVSGERNRTIKKKDIELDYDYQAILNSVMNILGTLPGERQLLPNFGCNLLGFIGLPVSTTTGDMIGDKILRAIKRWEPRVIVDYIDVVGYPDEHLYEIKITISIPSLNGNSFELVTTLSRNGFLDARIAT